MRQSNIELLRIISMMLIVLSHCCVHTNWQDPTLAQTIITSSLGVGEVGVVSFVLITGYFSWNKPFRFKSVLKFVLQVLFYSVTCFIFFGLVIDPVSSDFSQLNLLPITTGDYWFVTIFMGILITQPLINVLIGSLSKEKHRRALILLGILFCLVPFIVEGDFIFSNYAYFVFLYLLGGYFGKYPNSIHSSRSSLAVVFFVTWCLFAGAMAGAIIFSDFADRIDISVGTLLKLNSPFALVMGTCLFLFFEKSQIGASKVVNTIASSVFGVYLISDNKLLRSWVWDVSNNNAYLGDSIFILLIHILISVLIVFAICSIVDLMRINLVERPLFKVFAKPVKFLSGKIDPIMNLDERG